jgi:hypothetical protein
MFDHLIWQSPQRLPVALAAGVLLALAVIWIYRSQIRSVPAPWTWIVPALRLGAMGAILLAISRPVVVRLRNLSEQGAVVLLIDHSRSMSVVDAHRSISQRVGLADTLGMLQPGVRPLVSLDLRDRAEALAAKVDSLAETRSELEYAQLSGRGSQAAEQRLNDAVSAFTNAAASLRSDAASRNAGPRFLQACDALLALFDPKVNRRSDWTGQVRQRAEVVAAASEQFQIDADRTLYQSDATVRQQSDVIGIMSRLELVDRAIGQPATGLLANFPPQTPVLAFDASAAMESLPLPPPATTQPIADGAQSDLNGALIALPARLSGQSVQAVVLFSDGRQVGGSGAPPPALDVPLFTVGVAGLIRKDIGIARFDVPRTVFVGETANAHVEIAAAGVKDQPVDITVTAGNQIQVQHVVLNEGRTRAVFPFKVDLPGELHVEASISGIPADVTTANARAHRRVKVLADKVTVALISGSAGWDFLYLRNALQRTPWVQCKDEIVRAGGALHLSPDDLLNQQVIVLDDLDPALVKPEQWDAIDKVVGQRGGGVIVIAGNDVPPTRLAEQSVLASFLPWPSSKPPQWETWEGESAGYRLLPPANDPSDATRLSADPEENRRRWAQLPGMFRTLPIAFIKPNVRPLLVESESNQPVLTEARVGVGRAIFFGANETWRWRYKVGERDQDRFWLQMIREAGEAPYSVHDQTMALDLDNINPSPDQIVHVRARVLDAQGRPAENAAPSVRIETAAGAVVNSVPLRPALDRIDSGRYLVDLPELVAGDYTVRLVVGSRATQLAQQLHVEPSFEAEMADVSGDDANLRRLAETSGGEFLRLDQLRSLPGKLAAAQERRPQTIEYPIWDSPYLFFFVLGCLVAEWAMRKQFGLV